MTTLHMRYFASVAEAAGTDSESVNAADLPTVGDLRSTLAARGGEFARLIGLSALLVNGVNSDDDAGLPGTDDIRVDVLPPFAGG